MAPAPVTALVGALLAAACVGVGIGIGAAIWEGNGAAAPAAPASPAAVPAANATVSWLFVVRAESGNVTATGGDDLAIALRGVAPVSLAFTDRPAENAAAFLASSLTDAFGPDAAGYADGAIAPLNAALAFEFEGAAVALPVTILGAAGAAGDYTLTARAMPAEGGDAVAVEGGAAVRGTSGPLWAAMRAGLEVEAPALFVDNLCTTTECGVPPGPILAPPPPPPNNGCPTGTIWDSKYGSCRCSVASCSNCSQMCDGSMCPNKYGFNTYGSGPADNCCIGCLGTGCQVCGKCCTDACWVAYWDSAGALHGARPCGPGDCNCPPPPPPA
jgi:hypothetical protein